MCIRPAYYFLSVLFLCLGCSAQIGAETRAVLVGVSDYTYLDADLSGPRNDVVILAAALIRRGVLPKNITVLSDSSDGLHPKITIALPTRYNILSGLDYLAEQSQPGDTALFYFSGHGSQMPDQNGDEQGGYDEIFLPSDARKWKGSIGAVQNAIVDDELRQKAVAILARGARMVAILDACFSGTGFRAINTQGQARYLAPSELGVPDNEDNDSEPHENEIRADFIGDFVFLYSSQPEQRSFEYPLGDGDGAEIWYGDFTLNLVKVLQSSADLSYGQWLRAAKDGMRQGAATATQTPDGEGPMLSDQVFGSGKVGSKRMRIKAGILQRGLLSGITKEAEIAVFADAAAMEPLGTMIVASVSANSATLEPVTDLNLSDIRYGEILRPGIPAAFIIAPPTPLDPFDGYDYRALVEVVETFAKQDDTGVTISDTSFDAALILAEGALILTGPDGILDPEGADSSPRFIPNPIDDLAPQVRDWLTRIGRAHALRQAVMQAQKTGSGGFSFGGAGLQVQLERRQAGASSQTCSGKVTEPQKFTDGGTLVHCDQLWLEMKNTSGKSQDVTVLYIDRDFNISALWPNNNLSNRLGSGESKKLGFQMVNPVGPNGETRRAFEELIVLNVAAEPGGERTVLTGFADNETSRDVPDTGLEAYFHAASSNESNTRALSLNKPMAALKVNRFKFEILPQTGE